MLGAFSRTLFARHRRQAKEAAPSIQANYQVNKNSAATPHAKNHATSGATARDGK